MSREAIRELQERRQGYVKALAVIDDALKLMGAGAPKRTRGTSGAKPSAANNARSEAAKAMWAKRRAEAAQPKVKTKAQRVRNNAHPVQAVSKPASLAAAAEGN